MAVAKCGLHWSWDSPMWCRGEITSDIDEKPKTDKKCISCAWWKGNKKDNKQYDKMV